MKTSVTTVALALALAIAASRTATAQGSGVGGRFPDIARVEADYPDEAERFIAFDLLFNRLGELTRGAQTRADYELGNAYFSARRDLLEKYERQGSGSEAYKAFTGRTGSLFSDPGFRRSVLERYHLDVAATGPATAGGSLGSILFPERPGDRSDAEIKAAFLEALPVWGGATLAMIGVAWVFTRSAGVKTVKVPPDADSPAGSPQLPESLRTVSISGRRYGVVTTAGQVIDHTSVANGQQNLARIRMPDQSETSLTLAQGVFKMGQGDVISTIGRPLPDGTNDVLIAYNHSTGQLEMFSGVYVVHATRFLRPLFFVALVGSIPGAFGLGLMFHRLGGLSTQLVIALLTLWIMGGIASAIIAPFVVLRMKQRVEARRTERFVSDYIPEYRRFFSESTPALTRHFAEVD